MPNALAARDAPADITTMPTEDLRAELAKQLELTAGHLLRLATIVRTLEDRGEDLSDLKVGMIGYLRRIAAGQLSAEAVVRYADYPMLLGRIAQLSIQDQERLARGGSLKLMVRENGGGFAERLVDPVKLTRDQVHQVFANGGIRDETEQILVLEDRAARPSKTRVLKRGKVRADRQRDGLIVGRMFVPVADVTAALSDLRGGEDPAEVEEETTGVPVQLTEDERRALKVRAANADCTMNALLRRALRAAGLI